MNAVSGLRFDIFFEDRRGSGLTPVKPTAKDNGKDVHDINP